ncbi:MAG TPA: hypothetical protein ENJ95_09740 [Bacteroidetes bacterium]|nr:hypothetical protein [Bacteroidota bacterium]
MKYFRYILCLVFIAFSSAAQGQEKEKHVNKFRNQSQLELARDIYKDAPTKAIKIAEEVILRASKRKDKEMEGEAYVLLGNIYENIGQKELAVQRYEQALGILGQLKNRAHTADIYQRLGQLYIDLKDDKKAEEGFTICLKNSEDEDVVLKCQEGLADVELLRGNVEASFSQLDFIENNYIKDSIGLARNAARRSQVYLQQKDYPKASESFNNSLNSLPQNAVLKKEDFSPIQRAQQALLNFEQADIADKIAVQNNVVSSTVDILPADLYILENLKIASLYEKENNLPEAKKYIAAAKNAINEKTGAATVADVYKKSSEINQEKGQVAAALSDLEKYIAAKEKAIQNLEADLNQQIEIVKGQKEIDQKKQAFYLEEKERELLRSQLRTQKTIIGLLSVLLLASLVFFYFLYKNVKAKRKANQRLLLKSLRTQMNPHFIFNALNSVNNFIAKNDEKAANKFLSEFSRLMRKVLDHSQKDFISFEEEIELNQLYLKLEHFRFRDKFEYQFKNNAKDKGSDLEVPPMLIQPFIENAVWHGLRYKNEMGHLEVTINEDGNNIIVTIKDDGIGRKKSQELKTANQKKYKSTGLENISKRIALINEIYGKDYKIKVQDIDGGKEDTGTLVEIVIPLE